MSKRGSPRIIKEWEIFKNSFVIDYFDQRIISLNKISGIKIFLFQAVTRWSSESSSECDDWRTRFSNYSLTNEGPLNAAIDKINQFGVSTTQSEPNSDVKSDFSIPLPSNSCLKPFSRLDQIRLSDLTSDEDWVLKIRNLWMLIIQKFRNRMKEW